MSVLKKIVLFLLFGMIHFLGEAQNCNYTIKGVILDEHDKSPLEFASVLITETKQFVYCNELGLFELSNVCPGDYHLQINHLNCETVIVPLQVVKDTNLVLSLEHHAQLLQTITINKDKNNTSYSTVNVALSQESMDKKLGNSLSGMLGEIAGVRSIQTGSAIGSPIIHGMWGNRVMMVQNGVPMQSQQWGVEHAPEIDLFSADKISVIKGAYALQYGTRAMGGVVQIENQAIRTDHHIHGYGSYVFNSNGLGNTLALNVEQSNKRNSFAWRAQGTYTKAGDLKTPQYFLRNTGKEEKAFLVQMNANKGKHHLTVLNKFYTGTFGILRGSHIGSVTDLQDAFQRSTPFYTEDNFSYGIIHPKQKVLHNLLNVNHQYFLNKGKLESSYSFQFNKRQEFDVRRSSEKPSLFLNLLAQNLQSQFTHKSAKWNYSVGMQYENKFNFNDADLNVLPLIPNYSIHVASAYFLNTVKLGKTHLDIGARYEFEHLQAKYYKGQSLQIDNKRFNNAAFSVGMLFDTKKEVQWRNNLSLVKRAPEINELYSDGLHHGAAAIEQGNKNLASEMLVSVNSVFTYQKHERISIEINPYYQYFINYINLQASGQYALTIRGAFPIYEYKSFKAQIYGLDVSMHAHVHKQIDWIFRAALVRGKNLKDKETIAFMPADYFSNQLQYKTLINKKNDLLNFSIKTTNVFKQTRQAPNDFVLSPNGYFLLGAQIDGKIPLGKHTIKWSIEATNILNKSYRDYLNRWRYFADDMGANLILRTKYIF